MKFRARKWAVAIRPFKKEMKAHQAVSA